MGAHRQNCLSIRQRHLGLTTVCYHQPIFIWSRLQTMEDFSPSEFPLPRQIRADHPFMESSPICILWSIGLINCVPVCQKHNLYSISV